MAIELGNVMAASVIMVGALSALTGLVSLDALDAAVPRALPPYRSQHIERNQRALRAGFDAVPRDAVPAWTAPVEVAPSGVGP